MLKRNSRLSVPSTQQASTVEINDLQQPLPRASIDINVGDLETNGFLFQECKSQSTNPVNRSGEEPNQCPVPRNSLQSSLNSVMSLFSPKKFWTSNKINDQKTICGDETDANSMSNLINEIRSNHVSKNGNKCDENNEIIYKSEVTPVFKTQDEVNNSTQLMCEELLILANEQQLLLQNQRQRLARVQFEFNNLKMAFAKNSSNSRKSTSTLLEQGVRRPLRTSILSGNEAIESFVSVNETELYQTCVQDLEALPPNSPFIEPDFLLKPHLSKVDNEIHRDNLLEAILETHASTEAFDQSEWRVCVMKLIPENYFTKTLVMSEIRHANLNADSNIKKEEDIEKHEIKPSRIRKLLAKVNRNQKPNKKGSKLRFLQWTNKDNAK